MPVIAGARRSGQRTACLSNLHQAGQALGLYADDNVDFMPTYIADSDAMNYAYAEQLAHDQFCQCQLNKKKTPCWLNLIKPYLKISKLYCPADNTPTDLRGISSYEFKLQFAYEPNRDQVETPSKVATVWEEWAFHQAERFGEYDSRAMLNILFMDGSVASKPLARATSTIFGDGPDLHFIFSGDGENLDYAGEDFVD